MSGPIVRKYGFPNFEKIFGERPLEHGVDDTDTVQPAEEENTTNPAAEEAAKSTKKTTSKQPKSK